MGIVMIILGIVMFMSLVLIHELGHFWAAKKSGVKVKEFGIGIPPKVCTLRTDKSGTAYTLNWIPLGGFCALEGEDPANQETFHAKDSFISAKLWKKLIIIVAGVAMNLLTAWVIFTALFRHGMSPLAVSNNFESESYLMPSISFLQEKGFATGEVFPGALIQEIESGSLAESLQLQTEDIILAVNNEEVSYENLSTLLGAAPIGSTNTLSIQRGEEEQLLDFVCEEACKLGILITPHSTLEVQKIKFGLLGAMGAGLHEIKAEWNLTLQALGKIGKGLFSFDGEKASSAIQGLAGPVGAVKMGEVLYQSGGRIAYLAFAGMISLALAFFNILPIPALDGGRGIGILIQAIFKIKPEKYFNYEGYVNAFFFYVLMLLGIVIIFKDLRFFWGMNIPFVG